MSFGSALLENEEKIDNEYAPRIIKCPFRALVCGSSGSGKTFSFLNNIVLPDESPNKLIIWCSPSQSLKQSKLQAAADILDTRGKLEGIEKSFIEVPCDDGKINIERIEKVLNVAFESKIPTLLVFDDLVAVDNKSRRYIASQFMNGRHRNCSIAELRQRIFSNDGSSVRDARLNCNLYILCRFPSDGEVAQLCNQLINDSVERRKFMDRYKDSTKKEFGFLLVDLQNIPPWRFRKSSLDELYLQGLY